MIYLIPFIHCVFAIVVFGNSQIFFDNIVEENLTININVEKHLKQNVLSDLWNKMTVIYL